MCWRIHTDVEQDTYRCAAGYMQIHTHMHCIQQCICACIQDSNAYVYVFRKEIQSNTYRYALPKECICECMCMYVGCIFQTYRHICTGYSSYDPMIHTDTSSYIQIHTCAYVIYTVHMTYALCYIVCILACICVCMLGTYIQHISMHIVYVCA